MIAAASRLPILYEQKGHILALAGRQSDAKQAYQRALTELDKLPSARRNSSAMRALKARLVAATK